MLRLCLNGTSSVGPFLHSSSKLATDIRPTKLEKKYNSFGRRKVVQWNVGCWKFNFQRKALSLIRKLLVGFLAPQTAEKENTDRIPFALTFHPHNQAVKSVIFKNLLQNDSEIGIPTNSIARFSAYKLTQPTIPPIALTKCQLWNSLRWPIYVINSLDNIKLTHKDAKDAFLTTPLETRVGSNESCAKVAMRDLVTRFLS